MVPLRRALIVKEHGVLPYPEGTACAEVLVAGERGGKLAGAGVQRPRHRRAVEVAVVDLQPLPHRKSATRSRAPASSRTPRSTSTSRPSTWASATSSARASPARCSPAACCRGWCCCRCCRSWARHITDAVPADPSELRQQPGDRAAVPHLRDDARPDLERLHPLHRRRRGAGGRPDHAGAHHPDHRLVGARRPQGLRRRRPAARRCAPSATCR